MIKKKVVIIGGGFAGSIIAKNIEDNFETILIDTKEYFEYTPGILRNVIDPDNLKKIKFKNKNYLKKSKIIIGYVTEVNTNYLIINNNKLFFDYLVIVSGSSSRILFNEAIITKKGFILSDQSNKLERAKKIVIIGGGYIGVELVGEIIDKYKDKLLNKEKEIIVIHPRTRLMNKEIKKASLYIQDYFKKNNITIKLNEEIVKSVKYVLITNKGTRLVFDIAFSCNGFKPNTEFMKKNFSQSLNSENYIKVKNTLQVIGHPTIFAGGDVIALDQLKLAQNAEEHAKIIIENIRRIENNKECIKYYPRPRAIIMSLGKFKGLLLYKNFVFTGFIPGVLKNLLEYWITRKYK